MCIRDRAESLAAALAARGVGAVIEPLIEIGYRAAPRLDLIGVQAVLCTSGNGVRALARATGERHLPLLAVGDATAERARAEGFAAVASAGGAVGDLARLAAARLDPGGGRLLHVTGSAGAGDLAGELRARGFAVERVVLYDGRPATALSPPTIRALRQGDIDVALFFSPRTSAAFARLAAAAGVAACCADTVALAISTAADAPLAALPWAERRIAARPDQRSLLATLDELLQARGQMKSSG